MEDLLIPVDSVVPLASLVRLRPPVLKDWRGLGFCFEQQHWGLGS